MCLFFYFYQRLQTVFHTQKKVYILMYSKAYYKRDLQKWPYQGNKREGAEEEENQIFLLSGTYFSFQGQLQIMYNTSQWILYISQFFYKNILPVEFSLVCFFLS